MHLTRRLFLRQLGLGAAALSCSRGARSWAASPLPRSSPEEHGIASQKIAAFLDAMADAGHELHSFMLMRHGHVVAEGWWAPYAPSLKHTLYSLSKSFTSTAVGFAVAEGKLKVDDRVVSFFPKQIPPNPGEHLATLRVKDLLTMSVGSEKEPTRSVVTSDDWVAAFLKHSIAHPPGTQFMYNSAATYMCSAITQAVTGEKIIDYLRPRLFEPLGIENASWETCPRGICTGGWGLSVPTDALARFGQLYLQKGKWNGRQIIPASWIDEATAPHIQQPHSPKLTRPREKNDWLQGYGYQFWRCQHGGFRGDGAFGQFTIVLPAQDTVIAMTGESASMQGELDLVWEHLLPALTPKPLPRDAAAHTKLREKLGALALPPAAGASTSPIAARVSGKTFTIEPGSTGITNLRFDFALTSATLTARAGDQEHRVGSGLGRWHSGTTAFPNTPPRIISGGAPPPGTRHPLVASGGWTDANTFTMTWRYHETPHHDTVTCRFDGDAVKVGFVSSIAMKRGNTPEERNVLKGRLLS